MITVNPYLNFMGRTEEAFNFYKNVFGSEFTMFQRFKDVPGGEKMAQSDQEKIMHISLPIGNTVLMGTDTLDSMSQSLIVGNNFHLSINTESEAETDTIFHKLSEEGQITMPLSKAFWGAYFGMVIDKFGIQWMVSYNYEQDKK